MKKLLTVLFVAAVMVAGVFAQGIPLPDKVELPSGTFVDKKWDGEWVLDIVNKTIDLKDATTGEVICSFAKDKRVDEKFELTTEGAVWSFYYPETYRKYVFTKTYAMALQEDIILNIDPDWDTENYQAMMKPKK